VAVERSQKELHFLTALRRAADARFTILAGSLTEVRLPARPDVVLALNIFHHFLKTEAGYRQLAAFLGRLDARLMLFQAHLPGEAQMASAFWDPEPEVFAERVRELAGFARVRKLARAEDRRPIFLLEGAA
jgi:hypothetical protein